MAGAAAGEHPAGRDVGVLGGRAVRRSRPRRGPSVIGSGRATAGDELAGQLAVGLGARVGGAKVVIGSPASVASGNFTVRLMTVWKTWSPNASTTLAQDLAAVQGAGVVHRGEDAVDLQARVEPVADLVDRLDEQGDAAQGEELALQRDDHAVRGGQRVDGEQAERGLAVDEDDVVVVERPGAAPGRGSARGRPR